MTAVDGNPRQALGAATLGFFAGFASVALFGVTAKEFQGAMNLSPLLVGFLVATPALTGSLLRIPFAAWVDTTGGRKPFLTLLVLSVIGMAGLTGLTLALYPDRLTAGLYPLVLLLGALSGCGIATFSVGIGQVSYWFPHKKQGKALALYAGVGNLAPGIFSLLLPFALRWVGLAGAYLAWLAFLVLGTLLYFWYGRNAWYFQLRSQGIEPERARELAREQGQELFPTGNLKQSLQTSAGIWRTWALVWIYFTTFGGFVALTAWLPTYWTSFFGVSAIAAGLLTALYSVFASLVRIVGGVLSDELREGGENTAILALFVMLFGAMVMTTTDRFELALPGVILMAWGMGIGNAAVFKLVPKEIPKAVGGAAGWVGGLGAFGGFAIPPMLGFAVSDLGKPGYAIGYVVFIYFALLALTMTWILKYAPEETPRAEVASAGENPGGATAPVRQPPGN